MPITTNCSACKGTGYREYLISQHGDETYVDVCNVCNGAKVNHQMTDDEEHDYKMDNDW